MGEGELGLVGGGYGRECQCCDAKQRRPTPLHPYSSSQDTPHPRKKVPIATPAVRVSSGLLATSHFLLACFLDCFNCCCNGLWG